MSTYPLSLMNHASSYLPQDTSSSRVLTRAQFGRKAHMRNMRQRTRFLRLNTTALNMNHPRAQYQKNARKHPPSGSASRRAYRPCTHRHTDSAQTPSHGACARCTSEMLCRSCSTHPSSCARRPESGGRLGGGTARAVRSPRAHCTRVAKSLRRG